MHIVEYILYIFKHTKRDTKAGLNGNSDNAPSSFNGPSENVLLLGKFSENEQTSRAVEKQQCTLPTATQGSTLLRKNLIAHN